jgi:hypothetical protein
MKTNNYIKILLENGIHFNTISKLNKNQIKLLSEKFLQNEAVSVTPSTGFKSTAQAGDEIVVGDTIVKAKGPVEVLSKEKPGTAPKTEGEMTERFASKAQQKLFFAKCGAGKTKEQKKWCKLRDEFAKSTKKMDYKKMPEKLHPEKKVKYKKDRTDEVYQKYLEDKIFEMIEKHIEPSMSKKDIINTIQEKVEKSESMFLKKPKKVTMFSQDEGKEMKLPIGKLSYMGKSLEEDTKEKERTKTKPGTKTPTRRNPFKDPNPGVKEKPKADTKEKERTKEREKTKTPTRRNPFKDPNPGVKEKPKADVEKQKSDFMLAIKQAFNSK